MQAAWAGLLVLLSSAAWAGNPGQRTTVRTTVLSEHPSEVTRRIYVTGQVATVLRFEEDVDPAQTRLDGWEGRFEPLLVGSKKVVLESLHDLADDERVPLLVTLVSGTQIRFLVGPASGQWPWVDHQVSIFKDLESYPAVRSALYDSLNRERALGKENERLLREERSADHALARLVVNGQASKTAFRPWRMKKIESGKMNIEVETFSGPGKAAALLTVRNCRRCPPWRFGQARLSTDLTSGTERPFALRVVKEEIAPGSAGQIAIVADGSSFKTETGLVDLALQIFRRDGEQQVVVLLEHTLVRN